MGNIEVNSKFLVAKGSVSDIIVGNNIIDNLGLNINYKQHKTFTENGTTFSFNCRTLTTTVPAVAIVDVLVSPMCKLHLSPLPPQHSRACLSLLPTLFSEQDSPSWTPSITPQIGKCKWTFATSPTKA